jgi:hypothetical protein
MPNFDRGSFWNVVSHFAATFAESVSEVMELITVVEDKKERGTGRTYREIFNMAEKLVDTYATSHKGCDISWEILLLEAKRKEDFMSMSFLSGQVAPKPFSDAIVAHEADAAVENNEGAAQDSEAGTDSEEQLEGSEDEDEDHSEGQHDSDDQEVGETDLVVDTSEYVVEENDKAEFSGNIEVVVEGRETKVQKGLGLKAYLPQVISQCLAL